MDLQYILFNSVVYGVLASALAGFFAFWKILHLSLGAFLTACWYIIYSFLEQGFSLTTLLFALGIFFVYGLINWSLLRFFPHEKQRDHVSIVATLWLSIVIENAISYLYWPNAITLDIIHFGPMHFALIFVGLVGWFYYFFSHTTYGLLFKGIYENSRTIQSLWIDVNLLLQCLFFFSLLLLMGASFLILHEWNLRGSDWLFYLIKGIGVMIIVGIHKKEFMFVGALLYVLVEYVLFIQWWLPIAYKETLILAIILAILLFKPEWIFTFHKRKF